jgi:alkylation response protein AidB-like acyl-CoA dehydrogenase
MSHPYRIDSSAAWSAATAATLAAQVLAPQAADVDASGRFPREGVAALAKAGLLGLTLPTSHGGGGQGMRAFAAVTEELAMGCGSTAMIYVMHVAASQAIASGEKLADRDRVLREMASGEHLTTLAFSERGSRSLFWAPVSQLEVNGKGFRVSAEKSWVTSAANAQSYVTSAQRPGAGSPLESTVFLLRSKSPGSGRAGASTAWGSRQ